MTFFSRYWEAYKLEMEHFIDEVGTGGKTSISGKMVLAVFKICNACEKSGHAGKPVEITWKSEEIPDGYSA